MKAAKVWGNKSAWLKVARAPTLVKRDILLGELHEKEPYVAAWLESNLDETQWQCAVLAALDLKTYGIFTNNTADSVLKASLQKFVFLTCKN